MVPWRFKLLYDSDCPFCVREAKWLARRSKDGTLVLEDIAAPDFDAARYGLTQARLMGVLHGVFPDGRVVNRMAAFRAAYRTAGLGWAVAPTEWPVVRSLFDWGYMLFARNRVRIGMLLGRKCAHGKCSLK
jgi:predicted DCC family thiol-disulfide oxidoreductase YuxK